MKVQLYWFTVATCLEHAGDLCSIVKPLIWHLTWSIIPIPIWFNFLILLSVSQMIEVSLCCAWRGHAYTHCPFQKGGVEYLKKESADIYGLQEVKCSRDDLPEVCLCMCLSLWSLCVCSVCGRVIFWHSTSQWSWDVNVCSVILLYIEHDVSTIVICGFLCSHYQKSWVTITATGTLLKRRDTVEQGEKHCSRWNLSCMLIVYSKFRWV